MKQSAGLIPYLLLLAVAPIAQADDPPPGVALIPIKTAGSDDHGRITVNGRPFFPILMYDVPLDPDSLKMFREHGFNMLSAPAENATTLRNSGFYTAAHAVSTEEVNLDGVLFGVGMDSPALYWKEDLLGKSTADLANMRKIFPGRPIFHAIGYWEDEPAGVFSNKVPTKERYEELVKILDVSAPYLYPLPYQPLRSVGEAVGRANAASDGKKPLLPVLQLFVWKPEDPYPTPAELKCMAYLSLIHGADGIAYYSYNYVAGKEKTNLAREQPELWRSVRSLNAEMKQIGELLLDSMPAPELKVTAREAAVEWRAAAKGDSMLVLLANTSSEPQLVRVPLPSKPAVLRRIDSGVKVPLENGAAELTLGPNEAVGLQKDPSAGVK
jgi:hypothetical protein